MRTTENDGPKARAASARKVGPVNTPRAKREASNKSGRCVRCGEGAKRGYFVRWSGKAFESDAEVVRSAAKSGAKSRYCGRCAERRVREYEANRRDK